jgi:hypothetical protein
MRIEEGWTCSFFFESEKKSIYGCTNFGENFRFEQLFFIKVSMQSIFHPDAVAECGRVISCSAQDHTALCNSVLAICKALFPDGITLGPFSFSVVIPTINAQDLLGVGGQALARLQTKYSTPLFLRPANQRSASERLLACEGSLVSFQGLIRSLSPRFRNPCSTQIRTSRNYTPTCLTCL